MDEIHPIGPSTPSPEWLRRFNPNSSEVEAKKEESDPEEPQEMTFSPACRPHFRAALPDGNWTNKTKIKRLYFYHVRKAGGTNLQAYFKKVAEHHGLEFVFTEYAQAEDPGSHDDATFYVTHLRDPVNRSISHFKHSGRWDCRQLVKNHSFVPTEDNARKLETWNKTYGHESSFCKYIGKDQPIFRLVDCAVNCYSQWFSGLPCPQTPRARPRYTKQEVPMVDQRDIARTKLLRYNFIVITEMLEDPDYAAAAERFFGVAGIAKKDLLPWCERESHDSNERVPLVMKDETWNELKTLNGLDISLYQQLKYCLQEDAKDYGFPAWDSNRFETNETIQVIYKQN